MNKTLKIIGSLLTLLVLLPIIIAVTLQVTNLSEDEERISNIYQNQLQTILFSLNQYSEDFVSSWRNEINLMNTSNNRNSEEKLNKLFNENSALIGIYLASSTELKNYKYFTLQNENEEEIAEKIISKVKSIQPLIEKLKRFDNVWAEIEDF